MRDGKVGHPKSVDVYFMDNETRNKKNSQATIIACEVKFKSTPAAVAGQNLSLTNDIIKLKGGHLKRHVVTSFNALRDYKLKDIEFHRWLLLTGRFLGGESPWRDQNDNVLGNNIVTSIHPEKGVRFAAQVYDVTKKVTIETPKTNKKK